MYTYLGFLLFTVIFHEKKFGQNKILARFEIFEFISISP